MEEKNEFELIVSQGRRSIWMLILAAIFFTITAYCLYGIILIFWHQGVSEYTSKAILGYVKLIGFSLSGGVTFSVTKTILIDVDKNKLISRYFIGPFFRDVLSVVPELQYISVFLDSSESYQVNLWYKGNKHYNMYSFEERLPAFQFASMVAIKLKIDLLDATEKGNSKWIEKTNS